MPSTAIRQFDYDPAQRRLDVQFVGGRRYSYYDVPPHVADGMRAAASKGGYFNRLSATATGSNAMNSLSRFERRPDLFRSAPANSLTRP